MSKTQLEILQSIATRTKTVEIGGYEVVLEAPSLGGALGIRGEIAGLGSDGEIKPINFDDAIVTIAAKALSMCLEGADGELAGKILLNNPDDIDNIMDTIFNLCGMPNFARRLREAEKVNEAEIKVNEAEIEGNEAKIEGIQGQTREEDTPFL